MSSQYEKRILRVLRYIHENPAEDLSLDVLAEIAAMSRFHWHRVFHAMTGETCAQVVRRLRLFRAARWLAHMDWPIEKIATRVGYSNIDSFSRAFREEYGTSPGLFRQQGKPSPPTQLILKEQTKMFDVKITEAPARRLAALEHIGPYTGLGAIFARLTQTATTQNLWPQIEAVIGIHYDDPNVVSEEKLRAHAGIALPQSKQIPEGLKEVHLVGGKYAVLQFKGDYEGIKVSYDHLFGKWLPNSGEEPADAPSYELYLNDPAETPVEELLTEIYLPLK